VLILPEKPIAMTKKTDKSPYHRKQLKAFTVGSWLLSPTRDMQK
jgi:hypothetical protein